MGGIRSSCSRYSGETRRGMRGVTVLSGGTDGEDGPQPRAGRSADATLHRALGEHQLSADDFLRRHDAYTLFDRRRRSDPQRVSPART